MVDTPNVSLKIVLIAHFVLSAWAGMVQGFLPTSYLYVHAFVLGFGVWAIISQDSIDAVFMFMVLNLGSILMDIIFLGCFTYIAHNVYEHDSVGAIKHTYRFCLGMAIVNLLLKPFSSFVLYRIYQERGGQYSDFGIPGMPGFTGAPGRSGNYENIDQPVPSNTVESASPHSTIESPQGP